MIRIQFKQINIMYKFYDIGDVIIDSQGIEINDVRQRQSTDKVK